MLRLPRSTRRLAGVDVARGLALIGMMSVHIFPSFTPDGDLHPSYVVAAGRAAALFAVLAGVGLALLTGGPNRMTGRALFAARNGVLARAGLLIILGLLLGQVDSPPLVILAYYGVLFVVGIPFLGLSARPLAMLALAWAVVMPLASHLLRQHVPVAPVQEPGGDDLFLELLVTGTYPVLIWGAYLLAGLTLGRLRLATTRVATGIALSGLALAVVAKLLSSWLLSAAGGAQELAASTGDTAADVEQTLEHGMFGVTPTESPAWLLVSAPHSSTTFDLLHTIGTSMLVLGVCLLLTRRGAGVLLPLACAGSMTLTLYTVHVLVLADGSPFLLEDPLTLWLLHVGIALATATAWRLTIGRGPLEALSTGLSRAVSGSG